VAAGIAAIFLIPWPPHGAAAEPAPIPARIVWVRGASVYVAAADSLSLEVGDLVTFRARRRTVASGSLARVLDRHVAVVELSSGSLTREKRLDRLQVLRDRPPPTPPPRLRVGYPAAARAHPQLACEQVAFRPALPVGAYRLESRSDRGERLVRDPAIPVEGPWPDTLVIRFFEEAADQEIALELAELDVAIFWPGEPSRHLREQPRWGIALFGTRAGGAAPDSGAVEPLRCPVLCDPRLLPAVRAIGADALVNALACGRGDRAP
jgi:hypothetical protein